MAQPQQQQEESVLEILRRNDPEVTNVKIDLGQHSIAVVVGIAKALEQNDHVSDVKLIFGQSLSHNAYFTRLGEVLAKRQKLRRILLAGVGKMDFRFPTSAPVFRRLLKCIQRNLWIENCCFIQLDISGKDFFSFASSSIISSLTFMNVHIKSSMIATVTSALQQEPFLSKYVWLDGLDDNLWLPLMTAIYNGPHPVENLALVHDYGTTRIPFDTFNVNAPLKAAAAFRHKMLDLINSTL